MSDAVQNTDRELYREDTGDPAGSYYEDSVHVTESGAIGMNVGGHVIVLPIAKWHSIVAERMRPSGMAVVDTLAEADDPWIRAAATYATGGTLPPVPAPAYVYRATIVSNHDGDTLTATVSLGFDVTFTTNVRLLGMNARELSAPGGKEARDNLRALLPPGTVVTLTSAAWDKYGGRTDASITYLGADGQPHDLVGDLIADGWGAPYDGTGPTSAHVPPWPRTVA